MNHSLLSILTIGVMFQTLFANSPFASETIEHPEETGAFPKALSGYEKEAPHTAPCPPDTSFMPKLSIWNICKAATCLLPTFMVGQAESRLLWPGRWIPPTHEPHYEAALAACEQAYCQDINQGIQNDTLKECSQERSAQRLCLRTCGKTIDIYQSFGRVIGETWQGKIQCENTARQTYSFYDAGLQCPNHNASLSFPLDKIQLNRCFKSKFCDKYGKNVCVTDDNLPFRWHTVLSTCDEEICPTQAVERRYIGQAQAEIDDCQQRACSNTSLALEDII